MVFQNVALWWEMDSFFVGFVNSPYITYITHTIHALYICLHKKYRNQLDVGRNSIPRTWILWDIKNC